MALLSSSEGGDTVNHAGLADAELRNIEYKTIPADPWQTSEKWTQLLQILCDFMRIIKYVGAFKYVRIFLFLIK